MYYNKNSYSPSKNKKVVIGAKKAPSLSIVPPIGKKPPPIIPAPKNKLVGKHIVAIQKAIYALKCSDGLTLHEWAERLKTYYKARGGLPSFEGKFINVVAQAFIDLHRKGHARQIVKDRFVNRSGRWQVMLKQPQMQLLRNRTVSELKTGELKNLFIQTFNQECQTHEIKEFRGKNTDISEFRRFAMVRKDDNRIGPKTALVEFHVGRTPIEKYDFFHGIQEEYEKQKRPEAPALTKKNQIFGVNKERLDGHTTESIPVIVIGWQEHTGRLIAQYAEEIVICNQHGDIYNTHIESYQELGAFLSKEFGIQDRVSKTIMKNIRPEAYTTPPGA